MTRSLTRLATRILGAAVAGTLLGTTLARAQLSLQAAVDLSLKNSPRVRSAQADVDKAQAAWQEARDAYVPVVTAQAGYGQATGAPLGVPVVFSMSAQSLVFSFQQRDYVRAADQARESAQHSLRRERIQVVQDATNTYVALDNAQGRKSVLQRESYLAERLVTVTADRVEAGVDARVELPKSRRTALQIRLGSLALDDEIAQNARHLANLTGLPVGSIKTDPRSIPEFGPLRTADEAATVADDEGISALRSAAMAKQYTAFADRRYLLRPQITLVSNYSRVATGLSSYAAYYPRYAGTPERPNSENALSFGLQFTIPLLDMAHRAKARQSEADARRAIADVELQRGLFREGRAKLQNSTLELQLRADLAREEQEIAQDQFEAIQIQLQADSGGAGPNQASPRDALNAELQERQRFYDLLLARLQLQQTQVNLLQQDGGLSTWVQGGLAVPGTGSVLAPATNRPGVPGAAPPIGSPAPPTGSPVPQIVPVPKQ